jgi:SAM-dependent methyltransferase
MLTFEQFYAAFSELEDMYPRVLPLTLWRAWELGLYRTFTLPAPVLDLGCGDGQFFHRIWAKQPVADGIDISVDAVEKAQKSGVYRRVFQSPASEIPVASQTYQAIFSNCALEHMDHIDRVLAEASRVLVPGGKFLFSVVTDRLVAWSALRPLARALGKPERGDILWESYEAFHHLVNPLSQEEWL